MVQKGDGRDGKGRFARGNPGGPGRPHRETEREYLAILVSACPLGTWREVCARAVEDALAGDARARQWLASFLIGAPPNPAPSLFALAVEEMSASDPVEEAVADRMNDLAHAFR